MFVGHLAVGLLGKRAQPALPLHIAIFAAMSADLLVYVLLIARVERIDVVRGVAFNRVIGAGIAYSHSLAALLLWGALLAAAYFWRRRDSRAACAVFALVASHWFLDVVSHRPDMPLAPGLPWKLGFGLWNSMTAAMVVEGGLWVASITWYVRPVRFTSRAAALGFWTVAALLTLVWRKNIAAGMDPDPVRAGIGGLVFFSLVIAWAWWMERATASLPPRGPVLQQDSRATG
jgi:hypothetical protein